MAFTFPAPAVSEIAEEEQTRKQRCILCLEKMLEEARNGEGYESVFIVSVRPDGGTDHSWTSNMTFTDGIGRLEYLKHLLISDASSYDEPEEADGEA